MTIIDVSTPVHPGMTVWPGDPEPRFETTASLEQDGVRVSRLSIGSHTGTHLDSLSHFRPEGYDVHQVALERVVGPCRVLDLTAVTRLISARDLAPHAPFRQDERLLLKTRNSEWLAHPPFRPDFVAVDLSAAELLVENRVGLVGIDYLSVESPASPGFCVHHTLLGAGVLVLEGLELAHVEPGTYTLAALPLKLEGIEASPVRAILMKED